MREHDIDKNLISNIEISDEMRESLIQDVKMEKEQRIPDSDIQQHLMALCVMVLLVISGGSASAAY